LPAGATPYFDKPAASLAAPPAEVPAAPASEPWYKIF
jgi:hypothetical protein